MKITCSSCQAQYTVADEKIPPRGARVRCRKCQGVFTIPAVQADAPPAAPAPVPATPVAPPAAAAQSTEPPAIRPAPLPTIPPEGTPVAPAATPAADDAGPPIPEGLPPAERTRHERARRLARVLASDIAVYNQEKRERGLRDGNLVAVLGYEIKKSWETYKERVTPELANATPYFRDALNEMLAGGRKIF